MTHSVKGLGIRLYSGDHRVSGLNASIGLGTGCPKNLPYLYIVVTTVPYKNLPLKIHEMNCVIALNPMPFSL